LTDVTLWVEAWRYGEDRAARVEGGFAEMIVGGEPFLDRDELAPRIALKADEKRSCLELAKRLIDPSTKE